MSDEQPWTNSPSVLNYARVLRAVVADDNPLGTVEARVVADRLDITPEAVGAAFDSLTRDGLVLAPEGALAAGFTSDVVAKADAQARVDAWDAAATRSALRRACQSAVLTWLDSALIHR